MQVIHNVIRVATLGPAYVVTSLLVTGECNNLPKDAQPVSGKTGTLLDAEVQDFNHHAVLTFMASTGEMETPFYWVIQT